MANITLTIPDAILQRVIDAAAQRNGYQATVPDPTNLPDGTRPNPESKQQFAKRMLAAVLKDWVKAVETQAAASTAASTAGNKVDNEITIT